MAYKISDECISAALVLVNVQLELSQKEMASTLSMLIHVLTAALVQVHVLFQHLPLNTSIYKKERLYKRL